MELTPVDRLTVWFEPHASRRRRVGELAYLRGEVLFEFDPGFLSRGPELSPLRLRRGPGVVATPAGRLPGLFDDSLPDGWGRLLLDRLVRQRGFWPQALTPLDRLACVGTRGLGALSYEPQLVLAKSPSVVSLGQAEAQVRRVLADEDVTDVEALVALGSSPQGARPKIEIDLGPRGRLRPSHGPLAPGFEPWLVKFRGPSDGPHAGAVEHAYALMAAAAGIEVPLTRLLARTKKRSGYFATRRFDRRGEERLHLHSFGGLMEIERGNFAVDYSDLLAVTRILTRSQAAVDEMFRRACFNVFAHNRDDHPRNFAFLMEEQGAWRPSPAFDLTLSDGPGGEHSMLVMGEGRSPGPEHLSQLAAEGGVKRARAIIKEVLFAVEQADRFLDDAGVPRSARREVKRALATVRG